MEREQGTRKRKMIVTGFGLFLVFILAFSVFFWMNFQTVEVRGDSMEPTYHDGSRLLVSRAYWLVGSVSKGDVIVIKQDADEYIIKRVYALEGEAVDFAKIPDEWALEQGEYIVPAGKVYVLGDNKDVSEDSRQLGPFRLDSVIGKVVMSMSRYQAPAEAATSP